ncbi:MAG: DUF58 domain-containing protein [Caldithrix sp.]|nr:DUF58 domain-containing protein [Caldithrix sp.]
MKQETIKYLQPHTVTKLANLEMIARLMVEGYLTGLHKSPFHGFSVEFSQHRQYLPGDSLRFVDWKVYGRTDRYYIKQYEQETNLRSYLLLDISESMNYSSSDITKLQYAKYLSAALCFIMLQQRDAIGMTLFDNQIRDTLMPKSVMSYLNLLLKKLELIKTGRDTQISTVLHQVAEQIKRRGLIILLSDLLDDPEKILAGMKHFRHNEHEVLIFHILDDQEVDFDFSGDVQFEDLETSETVKTEPWFIKEAYQKNIREFLDYFRVQFSNNRIDYQLLKTSTPFDKALTQYLLKRKKLY